MSQSRSFEVTAMNGRAQHPGQPVWFGEQEARMDTATLLIVTIAIGSMLLAGAIAHDHGRSPRRWIWIAAFIGPLAIPLFYAVVAMSALRKATTI